MKKNLQKIAIAALLTGSCFSKVHAQGELLKTVNDAEKLMNAYMNPALKAVGTGLNGGWFNTAKPHGLGGFDLTVCGQMMFIPTSAQTFDAGKLPLQSMRFVNAGEGTQTPTFLGKDQDGPEVGVYGRVPGATQDSLLASFRLPSGTGFNVFPMATAQLTVGVGFGTEVSIRFFPTTKIDPVEAGVFGFGVKHDFKQWIPVVKDMPFDMSGQFGYTSAKVTVNMDEQKGDPSSEYTYNPDPNKKYDNEKIELATSAWTANIIVSKKLAFFTPYLGLGYQRSNTTLSVKGDYPVTSVNPDFDQTKMSGTPGYNPNDPNSHPKMVVTYTDPIKVTASTGSPRMTVGFRLKLAVVTIHADYTLAEYNMASAGIGINLQSAAPFKL